MTFDDITVDCEHRDISGQEDQGYGKCRNWQREIGDILHDPAQGEYGDMPECCESECPLIEKEPK